MSFLDIVLFVTSVSKFRILFVQKFTIAEEVAANFCEVTMSTCYNFEKNAEHYSLSISAKGSVLISYFPCIDTGLLS